MLNTGVACLSGAVTWFNALEALSAAAVAAKKTRKSHDVVWAVEEANKQLSILDLGINSVLCFRAPRAKIVREISSDVVSHTILSASTREQ